MINQDRLERALRDIGISGYLPQSCECECHLDSDVELALTEGNALKLIELAETLLDQGAHV